MGTRNLSMVVWNGETKVAQYGQWDGYPSGVGMTILKWLKTADLEKFKNNLKKARWVTGDEVKKLYSEIGHDIEKSDGLISVDLARKFKENNPQLDRDMAGKVFEWIEKHEGETILLDNNEEFATDGLFCEWAYVVDFDKNTFEVYSGFGKKPMKEGERFYSAEPSKDGYYPVSLVKSYPLDNLPKLEDFEILESAEAENEE